MNDERSDREPTMTSYSSGIGSPLARLAVALIALCAGAAAQGQSLQIAVSNSSNQTPNSYFNPSDTPINTPQNSNVIYGVTAMPQTGAPPALSLSALPINPVYSPSTPAVYGGFNSLTYAPSTQPGATVDLIAAQPSYASGAIWRFFGPTFSGTTSPPGPPDAVQVWSCGGSCLGPQSPISMAVDASGTLYVLSNDSNGCNEESNAVELWAFAKSSANASGFAASPVLIDPMVAGYGGTGCTERDYSGNNISISSGEPSEYPNPYYVRDLMIAPPGMMSVNSPVRANDVLVLFGDYSNSAALEGTPVALIADYEATNLARVLSGTGTLATPRTVANSSDIIDWGEAIVEGVWTSQENGDGALSFAGWPADSTMLVMTQLGNVFKFTWSSTTVEGVTKYAVVNQPVFATGLPSAQLQNAPAQELSGEGYLFFEYFQVGNLRTGVQAGKSYAFATAYTASEGPTYPSEMVSMDGINTPAASAMQSDGPMSSLAVSSSSSSGTGTGSGCVTGCNITGGVQQLITGTPAAIAAVEALGSAGTIVENVCIVEQDPRHICNKNAPPAPGNPLYNSKTLPVTAVCPNSHFNPSFGSTVIPDYICGNFGSGGPGTGTGFVLIQGIANGVDGIPGLLVYSDADPDYFFGTGLSEPCTLAEPDTLVGWAPWSGSPVEGTIPEGHNMIELTYGCGTSRGTSSGMSLLLAGGILSLNTASEFKPNYVSFAQYKYDNLLLDVFNAPIDLVQKVRLLEIVAKSDLFLAEGKDQCAVRKVWRADKYVMDHASHFHGVPGTDPNSYGRSRSRLANLFLTIFSRIEGNPAPQMWPVPKPPGVCPGNLDIDPDGY